MITQIGKFECHILRDAMQIAAQFHSVARMRLDADAHNIPVFMKDNLQQHLPDEYQLRQEFPKVATSGVV
jgi:hypothetical protein